MSSTSAAIRSNPRTHGFGWALLIRVGAGRIDVLVAGGIEVVAIRLMRQAVGALHAIAARALDRGGADVARRFIALIDGFGSSCRHGSSSAGLANAVPADSSWLLDRQTRLAL